VKLFLCHQLLAHRDVTWVAAGASGQRQPFTGIAEGCRGRATAGDEQAARAAPRRISSKAIRRVSGSSSACWWQEGKTRQRPDHDERHFYNHR